MAQFPEYLRPIGDLDISSTNKLLSVEYMDGMVKNISLQSRNRFEISLTYLALTRQAFLSFQEWFETDIKNGTSMFKWISPVNNVQYIARVIDAIYSAKPRTPNSGKGIDGAWEITLKIEYWK